MRWRLIEHSDPKQFADSALPRLMRAEAENCAQIGLVCRMRERGYAPASGDELDQPLLWTVQEDGQTQAVAIQTLRHRMLVTGGSDAAMRCIADALADRAWSGGVVGVCPSVRTLALHLTHRTGQSAHREIQLRAFSLEAVAWPTPAPGGMRQCTPADREILAAFMDGFAKAVNDPSAESMLDRADRAIADGRLFFWDDGHPVAMAGWAGRTPNGVRINSVYTPPEFRGRGYASNLVAHLSARMLSEGRKFCFLFTDQANPTSNGVYQRIGYQAVSESERWEVG
jgi:predicted GNAT family acetyltransferase